MNQSIPLIRTKLRPPVVRKTIVHRKRLIEKLQTVAQYRAVLLCGAPGSGKTTVLASALRDAPYMYVWYALSRADRDVVTFLAHLVAGIARQYPAFESTLGAVLPTGKRLRSELDVCLAALINQLCALVDEELVVVFDDFHLVSKSDDVRYVVDQLLNLSPSNVHFVITGRSQPRLPHLPELRATGTCLEITQEDLDFSSAEAAALFETVFGLPLEEIEAEQLVRQTEGWALGLLLSSPNSTWPPAAPSWTTTTWPTCWRTWRSRTSSWSA